MEFKAVVFDLDGTLVNTIKDIADSMNRVLESLSLPSHSEDKYHYFVGAGLTELCRRVLPENLRDDKKVREFKRLFNEDYNLNWHRYTQAYDGINDLLEFLQEKELSISILSNKPEEFCLGFVEFFFPKIKFTHVKGNIENIAPKPNPVRGFEIMEDLKLKPEEIIFVGDSDIDMQTAKNCGFWAFGAEWGFRNKEELLDAGADKVFKKPLDLLNYLKEKI